MSCFKPHGVGVGLTLSACVAVGDPLPASFLVERYGLLPIPTQAVASPAPDEKSPRRFHLQPEAPPVVLRFGGRTTSGDVGNITIDNMARRDYQHCRRLRGEFLERKFGRTAVQSVQLNFQCE
ncbi:hypothetical protein [Pseudomonas sp. Ost2]|uniref:hypothetical protein n=1 Tax=Pseudomonas sp. Ost2 TaxID=2678260 RepID=UPI001BB30304|nr:hypothetical protein [Pseudomonas sp. Ost2]